MLVAVLCMGVGGCANYTRTTEGARNDYYAGRYAEAAEALKEGANEEGKDQLLYILDRATALYAAAMYDESIKEFSRADKIAEIKDYTSLSTEAASVIVNDRVLPYKGEDFEKVLINQYLALCYLLKGELEAAQVENRRVNRKLYLMITQGKRKYRLNPMAQYLSGIIHEMSGEFNDAYIDYKAVKELLPGLPGLGSDLYRVAWRSGFKDDLPGIMSAYALTEEDAKVIRAQSLLDEVIVLAEVGKAPVKEPHPSWSALPKFYPRHNPVSSLSIDVAGAAAGVTSVLFDVESTAIRDLNDKWAGQLAKRISGLVLKETAATVVDNKVSPILGLAMRVGGYVVDQADLRSWTTLPQTFQVARYRLPAGESGPVSIKVTPIGGAGASVGAAQERIVSMDPGVVGRGKRGKRHIPKVYIVPARVM